MCGEHVCEHGRVHPIRGSSPHVRGAPNLKTDYLPVPGIIPACAGSTISSMRYRIMAWDHPRMCGEHNDAGYLNGPTTGSSPHVRGALYYIFLRHPVKGSSPHVRGAQRQDRFNQSGFGIIPACAGSTSRRTWTSCMTRDHPRMCGEHHVPVQEYVPAAGSSPHVRGAREADNGRARLAGIIPACAGST